MSLNGLDDPKLFEAYHLTLAEAGGWFLLKYASKDGIEVLSRGAGGVTEARTAIAQYTEKSPLYGILLYRRRKVLIKYIPDGTSRILKARVAVHFESVSEKFSPYDTIFNFASSDNLNDATLNAACTLHTATPSNGSTHRYKLDGITEDAEEGLNNSVDNASVTIPNKLPTVIEPNATQDSEDVSTLSPLSKMDHLIPQDNSPTSIASTETILNSPFTLGPSPAKSEYAASAISISAQDLIFHSGEERPRSTNNSGPMSNNYYQYAFYGSKPKPKLGPRPSIDRIKMPHTSGFGCERPIATLPAGLRAVQRNCRTTPTRPKSRDSGTKPGITIPTFPAIPDTRIITNRLPSNLGVSRSSIQSTTPSTSLSVTPEKQRLMKALELRNKKLRQAQSKCKPLLDPKEIPVVDPLVDMPDPTKNNTSESTKEQIICSNGEGLSAKDKNTESCLLSHSEKKSYIKSTKVQPSSRLPIADHLKADSSMEITTTSSPSLREGAFENLVKAVSAEAEQIALPVPATENKTLIDNDEGMEGKPNTAEEQGRLGSPDIVLSLSDGNDENLNSIVKISVMDSGKISDDVHEDDGSSKSSQTEKATSPMYASIPLASRPGKSHGSQTADKSLKPNDIYSSDRSSVVDKTKKLVESNHYGQLEPSVENSEADYLSDDSFMEELQSATLQEAKPISVSKSPVNLFFPGRTECHSMIEGQNSANMSKDGIYSGLSSHVVEKPLLSHLNPECSQESIAVAKKINISSGISQRIKALAEKSYRESLASNVTSVHTMRPDSNIVALRKSSLGALPSSPPVSKRNSRQFNKASVSSLMSSPNTPPILYPLKTQSFNTVCNVNKNTEKPDSVSVTARIIQDGRSEKPDLTMPTNTSPLELHQSPLIIDHQKANPQSVGASRSNSKPSLSKFDSVTRSMASPTKDLSRPASDNSWRSFGLRLSETKPSTPTMSRSLSSGSPDIVDDGRQEREKKESRTSRLFRRMSSSISLASRKNLSLMSPILKEEDQDGTARTSLSAKDPPAAVEIGELNVQFPDTLLWKLRWVGIDDRGNIVLDLSKSNNTVLKSKIGVPKRYSLSEFRVPYLPDQDRQEMPHSVILDFLDGGTLQCACEDVMGQIRTLNILRESHQAWMTYQQL